MQLILQQLEVDDADPARIADAAVSTLQCIDAALSPIISQRGVAALYRRSLHLVRGEFPWLLDAHDGAQQPDGFAALHSALSQQTNSIAVAGTRALLDTFHELLASLIGAPLTQRLLRSVWDHSSSGHAGQDISP